MMEAYIFREKDRPQCDLVGQKASKVAKLGLGGGTGGAGGDGENGYFLFKKI